MSASKRNFIFVGFDNDLHVSGKEVTGVVVAVIQTALPAQRVRILWSGRESVLWQDGVGQNRNCGAERLIFEEETTLLTFDDKVLQPGTHTFPFRWQLPASLPGSFEESESSSSWVIPENGLVPRSIHKDKSFIRYTALAQVEAIHAPSLESRSILKVSESFNPKLIGQAAKEFEGSKSFLLGGSGELVGKVSLTNGGVLFRGQKIIMNLKLYNHTSRAVDKVILWLNSFTTFQTNVRWQCCASSDMTLSEHVCTLIQNEDQILTRRDAIFAADVPTSFVGGGMNLNRDIAVDVPPMTPASLRRGKFIQRHFELTVEVCVTMGSNLLLKAPILILEWSPLLAGLFPNTQPQHPQPASSGSSSSSSSSSANSLPKAAPAQDPKPPARVAPQSAPPAKAEDSDEELSLSSLE